MKRNIVVLCLTIILIILAGTACNSGKGDSIERIGVERNEKIDENRINQNINNVRTLKNDIILEGENVGGLSETEIAVRLGQYSQKLDIDAREATVDDETWTVIKRGKYGKKVNVQKTIEKLFEAKEGERKKIVIEKVAPKNTASELRSNITVIGSYTTRILDKRDARLNNIHLAAERLDYEKVYPGEEFSFNGVLGKRTVKKGYEKAPIIIKTEKGPEKKYGMGGGICQLSSTLYNAIDKGGLKITERHSHSKTVGYVPKGKDAMVAYGSSDFKFVNNRSHPIMIRVFISKNYLTVKILENRNI